MLNNRSATSRSSSIQCTAADDSQSTGLPGFVRKLYRMVNDPELSKIIWWTSSGESFVIGNPGEFSKVVLPRYFHHNNFSSFVRQLNNYGFSKVAHLQSGLQGSEADVCEFKNANFIRGNPELLLNIHRKPSKGIGSQGFFAIGKPSSAAEFNLDDVKTENVTSNLLGEISAVKQQQSAILNSLQELKNENQHLWNETCVAREKYQQQQETINKILQFLASVFSSTNTLPMGSTKKNISFLNQITSDNSLNNSTASPSSNHKLITAVNSAYIQNPQIQSLISKLQSEKLPDAFQSEPRFNSTSIYEDSDVLQDTMALLDKDLEELQWNSHVPSISLDENLPDGIESLLKPSTEDDSNILSLSDILYSNND